MQAIYPYRWVGQFNSTEAEAVAKGEWQAILQELTAKQIERGLTQCRKAGGDFPPSIPQFRKMCFLTPQEIGILNEMEAYHQFARRDYSNAVVAMVSRHVDLHNFYLYSETKAKRVFIENYRACVEIYLRDEQIRAVLGGNADVKLLSSAIVINGGV